MDKAHQYHVENLLENDNETEEDVRFDEEKRKIYPYEPLPFPIIDLRTREVPISEVKNLALVNSAKIALESKFPNLSRRELNLSNNSITIFLKNYSLVSREAMNQSKFDRSVNRKHETRTGGDSRVSYFQNVPIGSPSTNSNRNILMSVLKKNHGGLDESEEKKLKSDFSAAGKFEGEKEEEREKPRIRHSRRQWEMAQKTANLNSRLRNDFNGTDHH